MYTYCIGNYKVIDILGQELEYNYEEQVEAFCIESCDIIEKYPDISHSFNIISIEKVSEKNGKIKVWYILNTYSIYKRYFKSTKHYFITTLNNKYPIEIDANRFYRDNQVKYKEQEEFSINRKEGELLAFSFSKNRYITKYKNEIHFYEKGRYQTILKELYNSTKYKNAYFTSDGKTIVLKDNDEYLSSFGLESFLSESFDIQGIASFRKDAYNGYKPEIFFNKTSSQKPVWRDPISLSIINPNKISNIEYISPDNLWSAKSKIDTIYYNRLTGKNLKNDEYLFLCKVFDFKWNSTDKEKSIIIGKRKKLYFSRKKDVESLLRESNINVFNNEAKLNEYIENTIKRSLLENKILLACLSRSLTI